MNESKSDRLPQEWVASTYDAREAREYVARHDLGEIPPDITEFNAFYDARRCRLLRRLRQLLSVA